MSFNTSRHDARSRFAALWGSVSLLTLAGVIPVLAQGEVVAQAEEIPETVLITGSLIRGTAVVGVPVVELRPLDFVQTGALTVTDLFRTVPSAVVQAGALASSNAGNSERSVRVNLRGLDSPTGARSLFMVDGARVPLMSSSVCIIDPSIIPALSIDRIDVLVDGASATYGSDAIAGVLNIILKRGYDGAVSQLRYTAAAGGGRRYQASQLWGRTWDGGGVTITYEWHEDTPMMGNFHSQHTIDHRPWGFDDRRLLADSIPGTISTGVPRADPAVNHGITGASFGSNCTNCYAIPLGTGANWDGGATGIGPTAPSSASTLNWASFATAENGGTNGTRNVTNPYHLAWYSVAEQANRAVITVDQRLTSNISFYGDGYYSNRRSLWLTPPIGTQFTENATFTMPVPTFNPYYPAGAPPGLQVSYTTFVEKPGYHPSYQVDGRYLLGLNFGLPGSWAGKVYYSDTFTQGHQTLNAAPNKNAISAALGWTIAGQGAIGTTPALASWTKPGSVPYLNLFCDPTQFVCNSADTLSYIMGTRNITSKFKVNEKGATVDGPLFDLPAGPVKAAIGASYTTYSFSISNIDTRNAQSLIPILNVAPEHLSFWAVFTQLNVPVIGDDNRLPLVDGFELEGSWRHDQYDQGIGGTSNAKAAFNWRVSRNLGLTIRGAWGESFRAPGFGETSNVVGFAIFGWNLPVSVAPPIGARLGIACTGGVPNAGSGAAKVFNPAAGRGCGSAPGGVNVGGGNKGARSLGLRDIVNTEQYDLEPEKGTNWSLGFDLSPATFLQGLNIQATWYKLKVSGPLDSGFLLNPGNFNSPEVGWKYIVPSDLGCPLAANDAPLTCPEFAVLVDNVLANPRSTPSPAARSLIYWINDSGGTNGGWEKLEGIDFTASYDWEWPDLGAFNVGIVGSYYLNRNAVARPGGTDEDAQDPLYTTISVSGLPDAVGVPNQPRMRYRARLGWANGAWSVTGFFNYRTHYWTNLAAPPNVNNQCQTAEGTIGGGTFPCAISDYNNLTPPIHTFDLSIGYDTADRPANEYLRNIGFQIIVQNVFDRHPPYAYVTGARPGAWATGAQGGANEVGAIGRTMSLILTKTW